jgi:hypothetical protein
VWAATRPCHVKGLNPLEGRSLAVGRVALSERSKSVRRWLPSPSDTALRSDLCGRFRLTECDTNGLATHIAASLQVEANNHADRPSQVLQRVNYAAGYVSAASLGG